MAKPKKDPNEVNIELVRWTKWAVLVNGALAAIALGAAGISLLTLRASDIAAAHTEENQSAVMAVVPSAVYGQPFIIKNAGGGPALHLHAACVATNTSTWPTSFNIPAVAPDVMPIFPNNAFQVNIAVNACGKAGDVTPSNLTGFYAHIQYGLPWGEIRTEDFEYEYVQKAGWTSRSADAERDKYAAQIDATFK